MKRRRFAEKTALAALSTSEVSTLANAAQENPTRDFYELKIYTKRFGGSGLEAFLESVLIPSLNRHGVSRVVALTFLVPAPAHRSNR